MRTATADELTVMLDAEQRQYLLKVEVLDTGAVWQNLSNLQGYDWVVEASVDCERIDQPVASASVSLKREAPYGLSMAPLMSESPVNIVAAAYSPLLDVGVFIRISCGVIAANALPVAGDYKMIFEGRIDSIKWASDPIMLTCSDKGAWLMDAQIESSVVYGSGAGVAIETVIQDILDDTTTILGTVTLQLPDGSPGWALHEFTQDRVKLLDAVRALAAQIGWEVAYGYTAGGTLQLQLFEVDRAKTAADKIIGPTQYINITTLNLDLDNIRNVVRVPFYTTAGALNTSISASDSASITKLGRRYMEIAESATSNIDSTTEAQLLADAAVSDLVQPPFTHDVEMPLFWIAQFGDLYQFSINGVHYDDAQKLAVVGVRHAFQGGEATTTLSCAGKVRGAYREWLKQEVNRTNTDPPYLQAGQTMTATASSIAFVGGPLVRVRTDGGTWAAATSPIATTRNAVGGANITVDVEAYAVAGRADSVRQSFIVLPKGVTEGGAITLSIGACTSSNAGAAPPPYNRLVVPLTYSNMPAGTVFDVSYNNGVSGGVDSSSGIAMTTSPQDVTFNTVTFAGTPGKGAVTAVAKLNGQVIATAVRNATYVT